MASSSSSDIIRYHAYLSFHGPDLPSGFLSQLHNRFASKGITTFNDQNIERGQTIGPESVKAIKESKIAIVVLSKNYASSSWCLDELVEILKCKEASGQIVIPIFHRVSPSLIRTVGGAFGRVFKKTCEGKTEEVKLRWRNALAHVGSMAGEDCTLWSDEASLVENIATRISDILKIITNLGLYVSKTMGKQVERKFTWLIKNLSSLQSEIIYSDSFVIGGCKWRLIAYPKRKCLNYLTLEVADCEYFLPGWRRQANFSLTILDHVSEKIYRRHVTQHWFDHKTPGFYFILSVSTPGFFVDEEVKIVVEIDVRQVIDKVDVNGFQVLPSHVNRLFEKHPEIASKFRIKNPLLKTAYMNILLSLTETLRLSPQQISKDDLSDSETTLAYMTKVGFKLDWLEKKFREVKEKKAKEKDGEIRMQGIEEKLKVLKQKCSDLEAQLEKEKAEVLAARAPVLLSDDDDVV